ncbi:MAG: alpha/beta hydrolase [Rikenellaceae bacterium]
MRFIALIVLLVLTYTSRSMTLSPETYTFAQRGDKSLEMDIYHPDPSISNGICVVYSFGGGFVSGSRESQSNIPFYEALVDRGYTVVAFDYRLALVGVSRVGVFNSGVVFDAVDLATEDLLSALSYLIEHHDRLGVDTSRLALVGSSAGAIISLQADYYLSNRDKFTDQISADFRLSAVVSMAGSIFSRQGKPKYAKAPSPTMMLHGTDDRVVIYNQIRLFNRGMFGTKALTKIFERNGYAYQTLRFEGAKHEVAEFPREYCIDQIDLFLRETASKSYTNQMDVTIKDRYVRENFKLELNIKDLYNGN